MKKSLIVLTSLGLGGAERQALNYADYLLKHDCEVEVLGLSNPGKVIELCKEKGIQCNILEDTRSIMIKILLKILHKVFGRNEEEVKYRYLSKKVATFIKKNRINSCISYCSPANTIACYAKKYYPKCKYTWYQRDDGLCFEPYEIRDEAIHLADNVLANGISGREWISKNHSIEAMVIHNGVSLKSPIKSRDEWRKNLGIEKGAIVCTMIAHFSVTKKDHFQNVNVIKKLIDDGHENFVMLFAGRPDDKDYYEDIRNFVTDNNIEANVKFLGEVDDITGLLKATDICFFGTKREGNPNGVIEAAMLGLPIVASDLPEIREVVAEENCEYLFNNGDFGKAEESLLLFADNPELMHRLGELNKSKAEADFSTEKNFGKLMKLTQ